MKEIDFPALIRMLSEAGVEFIVIGGVAAIAHGSARGTFDLDVVYRRTPENIRRVSDALAKHSPYLRGAPLGLPFKFDPPTIQRGLNFTLSTDLGPLDLLGEVAGGGTYEDLLPYSVRAEVFGGSVWCLGLRKLIQTKRAAGRPKDNDAIAELERLLERIERS